MKFIKLSIIFVLILINNTNILSQSNSKEDSITLSEGAYSMLLEASALFRSNLDSALLLSEQALPLYYQAKDYESYVETLNAISTFQYLRNDFEQFKVSAQKALNEAIRLFEKEHYTYTDGLNNLAMIYQSRGDYDKSIQLFNQVIELNKDRSDIKKELAIVYQNQAHNFRLKEDFQKAINYQKQALDVNLDSLTSDDPILGINYQNIGFAYKEMLEYDSSLVYLTTALTILNKPELLSSSLNHRNTITTLHGFAEVWLLKENPKKAKWYIEKAIALQNSKNAFRKAFSYELLANIYIVEKDYSKALESIFKSNHLTSVNLKNGLNPKTARKFLVTAKIYHLQNNIDSALVYTQKAIEVLAPEYEFVDKMDNPQVNNISSKSDALDVLSKKASLLKELYYKRKEPLLLSTALNTYNVGAEFIRDRRNAKLSNNAKNKLAEKSIAIYEGAISTALEMYKITNDTKYRDQAFILAENNKSLLLLETINEQFAQGNAELPDSLLKQEKELKIDLAFYQKQILIEKQKKGKADQKKLKLWRDYLFKFQQEHDILISRLEENYSEYYNLKYKNAPASLQKIRTELLTSEKALIEYFIGDENIYIFCLTTDDLLIKTIKTSELNLDEFQKFRTFISTPPNQGVSSTALQEYRTLAYRYFELLIKPVVDQLDRDVNELIIIPDGILAYIPFDVLLTTLNQSNPLDMPKVEDFLLHRYSIGYDYSATLLVKNTTKEISSFKSDFIAFAPTFHGKSKIAMLRSCDGAELSQLRCNQEEVENISAILNGQLMLGPQASVANFKNLNGDHNIIHLATHACADTENPLSNKVYFSDDNMSILDFNNTRLNTQLVVLSACNTGYGKILKGEGVMSIARGLMVAGSPSTMLSLWSVDDCATSDLMSYYYTNLKEGKSKNKALRNAKMKYLESAPKAMKHPFYWGAFVQFGSVEPVHFSNGTSSWIYFSIFGFLFLALIFYIYR